MSDKETCEKCGAEYTAGAPHNQFCPGNIKGVTECEVCGKDIEEFEEGESESFAECRGCGNVFCDDCGSTISRQCYDCDE